MNSQQFNVLYIPKCKKSKQQQALRKGDWICCLCGNLNFSFRNECNRCQVSPQAALALKNKKKLKKRQPFKDLTNKPVFEHQGFENMLLITPIKLGIFDHALYKQGSCFRREQELKFPDSIEITDFDQYEDTLNDQTDPIVQSSIMLLGIDD